MYTMDCAALVVVAVILIGSLSFPMWETSRLLGDGLGIFRAWKWILAVWCSLSVILKEYHRSISKGYWMTTDKLGVCDFPCNSNKLILPLYQHSFHSITNTRMRAHFDWQRLKSSGNNNKCQEWHSMLPIWCFTKNLSTKINEICQFGIDWKKHEIPYTFASEAAVCLQKQTGCFLQLV